MTSKTYLNNGHAILFGDNNFTREYKISNKEGFVFLRDDGLTVKTHNIEIDIDHEIAGIERDDFGFYLDEDEDECFFLEY